MEYPVKDLHFSDLALSTAQNSDLDEGSIMDSPDHGDEEVNQGFSSSKRPVDASPGTSPQKKSPNQSKRIQAP
jgi:hypothetical protein